MLQNISGSHAATWWQKLAGDFPSLPNLYLPWIFRQHYNNVYNTEARIKKLEGLNFVRF